MHSLSKRTFSCPACPYGARNQMSNVAERDLSDLRRPPFNRTSSTSETLSKTPSHSNSRSVSTQQEISYADLKERIRNVADGLRLSVMLDDRSGSEESRPKNSIDDVDNESSQPNRVSVSSSDDRRRDDGPSINVALPEGRILVYRIPSEQEEETSRESRDTRGRPGRTASAVDYSEENCAVLLRENYDLIKKVNSLRNCKDRLQNRVRELKETNENLKTALSSAVNERNRLMSNMPSPRLYCNFTVTKMYEQWVRALRNELQAQKEQHLDTLELLRRSSESEQELSKQVARLEDSLMFFRQITREMASAQPGGGVDLPEDFDALYEEGFVAGIAGGQGEKIELYSALLEENEILRRNLRQTESQCSQKSREVEELRQQLQAVAQEPSVDGTNRSDLMERCLACFEQLKNVKEMLDLEREKLRMERGNGHGRPQ